jgi:hypothetical protein
MPVSLQLVACLGNSLFLFLSLTHTHPPTHPPPHPPTLISTHRDTCTRTNTCAHTDTHTHTPERKKETDPELKLVSKANCLKTIAAAACRWHMPVILALRRQRSGGLQFEASPGKIVCKTYLKNIHHKKMG